MTFQDFLAASQVDERLAWARFLMWNGLKTNPNFPQQATPEWAEFCSTATELLLGVADFTDDDNGTDYLAQADAVLAELARQREEAWQGGYEQGRDSER